MPVPSGTRQTRQTHNGFSSVNSQAPVPPFSSKNGNMFDSLICNKICGLETDVDTEDGVGLERWSEDNEENNELPVSDRGDEVEISFRRRRTVSDLVGGVTIPFVTSDASSSERKWKSKACKSPGDNPLPSSRLMMETSTLLEPKPYSLPDRDEDNEGNRNDEDEGEEARIEFTPKEEERSVSGE